MGKIKINHSSQPFQNICIISDLDDTLLNSNHEISPENMAAIRAFIDGGGQFGLATGRGAQSVARLQIPMTLPAILYNGSSIMNLKNRELLWNCPLDSSTTELVGKLLERFPDAAIELFTFNGIYLISENEESRQHIALERITPLSFRGRHFSEIPAPWQKLLVAWNPESLKSVEAFMASSECAEYPIKFHRSYDFLVELIHPECGKEIALKKLSELYDIPIEHIIAIGDNQNDLGFIKNAGTGIAVGNAQPEIREAADYITVDNDHHVMAELLRLLKEGCL